MKTKLKFEAEILFSKERRIKVIALKGFKRERERERERESVNANQLIWTTLHRVFTYSILA